MKIGIFGGTFDPIHKGHIALAKSALKKEGLDKVYFMPTHINWMKKDRAKTDDLDRIRMIEKSIAGDPSFGIETYEIHKGGISYTCDTLRILKDKYKGAELFFIMGEDSLRTFPFWRNPDEILKYATILVAGRDYNGLDKSIDAAAKEITDKFGGCIKYLDFEKMTVSSSFIREHIINESENVDLKNYLSDEVICYIKENRLYLNGMNEAQFSTDSEIISSIRKRIKKELDRRRYVHTLGVAYTASCMAMAYNADIEDAYIAGLLHDCAKCLPADKKLELAKKYGIELNEAEKANPDLLHAALGSYLARDEYGIENEDIINAIRFHTTGRAEMSLLEKIVYLADYIEPNRKKILGIDDARSVAFTDINKAMAIVSENVLLHLEHVGAKVDEYSLECNSYYKSITE